MLMRELPLVRCVLNWNVDTFNVLSWQHFLIAFIAFSVSYGKRVQCEAKRKCHSLSARRIERRGWSKHVIDSNRIVVNVSHCSTRRGALVVCGVNGFPISNHLNVFFLHRVRSCVCVKMKLSIEAPMPLYKHMPPIVIDVCEFETLTLMAWYSNYIFLLLPFTFSIAYTLIRARQQFAVARSILLWEDEEEIASAMRQYCMRFTSDDDIK